MNERSISKSIETLSNRIDTLELQMAQLLNLVNRLGKPNEEPHIITIEKQDDWKSPEFNKDHISCNSVPTDEPQYPIVELFKIFNKIPTDEPHYR